jgi:hypothetical protein
MSLVGIDAQREKTMANKGREVYMDSLCVVRTRTKRSTYSRQRQLEVTKTRQSLRMSQWADRERDVHLGGLVWAVAAGMCTALLHQGVQSHIGQTWSYAELSETLDTWI